MILDRLDWEEIKNEAECIFLPCFLEDLQSVPNPRFGDEVTRSHRVRLDLSPQVADIDLQHVRFAFVSRSPDHAQ